MLELLNKVNWVDVLALILLLRISYVSSRIGVGRQILPCVFLLVILPVIFNYYRTIASFFIGKFSFAASGSEFIVYFLLASVCFFIYALVSRLAANALSVTGEPSASGIEATGGMLVGAGRAVIITGIIVAGLLLAPVRFIDSSVKNSFSGPFFVKTTLRVYGFLMRKVFGYTGEPYESEKKHLFSSEKTYFLDNFELKTGWKKRGE